MINGATVTLSGYVATEPSYRMVNGTTPVVNMRVAWTSRYVDRATGEWRDGKTSFANVNCWRKLAGNVAPSLRKGEAVMVTGKLQVRDFEDREGRARLAVDIEADTIGHDLSRGVSHFQRTSRTSGNGLDGVAMGEAVRGGLVDEHADSQGDDDPFFADAQLPAEHGNLLSDEAIAALDGAENPEKELVGAAAS